MKAAIILIFISLLSMTNTLLLAQNKANIPTHYALDDERFELFKTAIIEALEFEIEILLEEKKDNLIIHTKYMKERLKMKNPILFWDEVYQAIAKIIVKDEMLQDELIDKIIPILEKKKPKKDKDFKRYYKANEAYFSQITNRDYDGLLFMDIGYYFQFNKYYSTHFK